MTLSGRPVRTTIVFGLLAALAAAPLLTALELFVHGPRALGLTVWLALAVYGLLLARWARTGILGILFPLLVLLLFALTGDSLPLLLLLAAGILAWIRSGVCFPGRPVRTAAAELLLSLGGGALVLSFHPASPLTWALGLWMFFLLQSLYFPLSGHALEGAEEGAGPEDPFEQARAQAERILSNGP